MKTLDEIRYRLRSFATLRDWDQFHSPKNLSMALSVEASELVECFQWLTEEQSGDLTEEQHANAMDEIADIQMYLVRIADKLEIDILAAVTQKMKKNEQKYPVDQVKGSARKYTSYESRDPS